MKETWLPIKGYEDSYCISTTGKVLSLSKTRWNPVANKWSVYKQKELKQGTHNMGYKQVTLVKNGDKKTRFVHRLVADAFLTKDDNNKIVGHIDHSRDNNNYTNLVWCTQSENIQHAANAGRIKGNNSDSWMNRERDTEGRFI